MIVNTLRNNSGTIVTTVMVVFSMAFVCDVLCDLEVLDHAMIHSESSHSHGMVDTASHHDHDSHEHSHGHGHHHEATPSAQSHHGQQPGEEDCCEEETSQFYASLVAQDLPSFEFERVWVAPGRPMAGILTDHAVIISNESNPYRLNSSLSPPAYGLTARILFQSFLC